MKTLHITVADDYVKKDLPGGLEWYKAIESRQCAKCRGRLVSVIGQKKSYCCLGIKCELDGILNEDGFAHVKDSIHGASFDTKLALPRDHKWSKLFDQNMPIPEGVAITIIDDPEQGDEDVIISNPMSSLAEINDNTDTWDWVLIAISTCWNLLPQNSHE